MFVESFIVRVFPLESPDAELKGEIVHVRSGERTTFRSADELAAAMRQAFVRRAYPFFPSPDDAGTIG